MSATQAAFVTDQQHVLDALRDARERAREWHNEMDEWVRANIGAEFAPAYMVGIGEPKPAGVRRIDDADTPGPGKGWRWVARSAMWKPDKRTKFGKQHSDRFDPNRNRPPSVRSAVPGMPSMCLASHKMATPGLLEDGDRLWVSWSIDLSDDEWEREGVDWTVWRRARLSEYHAARERIEDAEVSS